MKKLLLLFIVLQSREKDLQKKNQDHIRKKTYVFRTKIVSRLIVMSYVVLYLFRYFMVGIVSRYILEYLISVIHY